MKEPAIAGSNSCEMTGLFEISRYGDLGFVGDLPAGTNVDSVIGKFDAEARVGLELTAFYVDGAGGFQGIGFVLDGHGAFYFYVVAAIFFEVYFIQVRDLSLECEHGVFRRIQPTLFVEMFLYGRIAEGKVVHCSLKGQFSGL